jgi:hypothetical protein
MKDYRVVWEIDIAARSHLEAAKLAREIQADPESAATFFKVYDNTRGDVGIVAPGFENVDASEDWS